MKPTDLQQMMQQYQLIAENNGDQQQDGLNLQARYDEIMDKVNEVYRQMSAAIDDMRQFLEYAENFDFEITYDDWAENMEDACRDLLR